ncbi:MAG: alcohol dehydrogenase catalytic domain-containing protein, partial [Pseudomonadota bacterium]
MPATECTAVVLAAPLELGLQRLSLHSPGPEDVLVDVHWSGISTGTEKLLYLGEMPPFPGLGYPLVPGYEAVGEVSWAGPDAEVPAGTRVFVPGANCFDAARGLFGASASQLVVPGERVVPVSAELGSNALLIALAATAEHALSICLSRGTLPELIVGHGTVGRLLARLCLAHGAAKPPVVWEKSPERRSGAEGYEVVSPEDDTGTY